MSTRRTPVRPHLGGGQAGRPAGEHLMAWLVLILSGLMEAGWALSLKASDGFSKPWPSVGFVALLTASMAGLSWALRTLPVGVAYAVWVGIGAIGTAVVAMIWLGEGASVGKILSLVLIVAGVVGLNLSGSSAH